MVLPDMHFSKVWLLSNLYEGKAFHGRRKSVSSGNVTMLQGMLQFTKRLQDLQILLNVMETTPNITKQLNILRVLSFCPIFHFYTRGKHGVK